MAAAGISAVAYAASGNWKEAALMAAGVAACAVGAGALVVAAKVAINARRIVQTAKAAQAGFSVVKAAKATRLTAWVARRMWVGKGYEVKVAKNGAEWLQKGKLNARGPGKKGKYGWSANLEYSQKGFS